MTKLYKAVDREDLELGNKCWLVNERGVAVSLWTKTDDKETESNKYCEKLFLYDNISRFEKNAIDPILIAEW